MSVTSLKKRSGTLDDSVERRLRVQLAAAYRIADHLGWSELIYTHISLRVPGPGAPFPDQPLRPALRRGHRLEPGQDRPRGQPGGRAGLRRQQGGLRDPRRDPRGARRRAVRLPHPHPRRHGDLGAAGRPAAGAHVLAQLLRPARLPRLRGPEHAPGRAAAPGGEPRRAHRADPAQPRSADASGAPCPRRSCACGAWSARPRSSSRRRARGCACPRPRSACSRRRWARSF